MPVHGQMPGHCNLRLQRYCSSENGIRGIYREKTARSNSIIRSRFPATELSQMENPTRRQICELINNAEMTAADYMSGGLGYFIPGSLKQGV